MQYEEIKALPPDTLIKVRITYHYSPEDMTPSLWNFILSNNAIIEHEERSNTKVSDNEA